MLAAWQRRNVPKALEDRQHEERGISFRDEPTGNRTATIQLSADLIAMLEVFIDAETGNASADASDPHPTLRHQRADAFARIIERMVSGSASADASAGVRRELILHRRVGETSLTDGTVLPPAVARYCSCECDVRVMTLYPDGSPADVGRRHRLVTPRLLRLVLETRRLPVSVPRLPGSVLPRRPPHRPLGGRRADGDRQPHHVLRLPPPSRAQGVTAG